MITKLTKEQEAKMPEYVKKYTELGLATKPFTAESKKALEGIIARVYAAGGLKKPQKIVFCKSPQDIILTAKKMDPGADPSTGFIYGSQDSGWLSFYNYYKTELGVTGLEPIDALTELLGECSFLAPYENICFVSQNLSFVHMVEGRLHCATGPAWGYEDGFCGYSLDGVAVPETVIDAILGKVKPESVLSLENVEQRLVAIKYVGINKLLKALNGRQLDVKGEIQADGKAEYILHEITLEGNAEKLLEMKNPSEPKRHYEFVPPEIKTCNEALAWRIGWNLESFKPPVVKS